mmetsp:Transcript_37603/g.91395  ORF Transcript_37603/g.91395 Transcript_37603/m.91395 type:complete len:90 (-) Transcript_37603:1944-2213(-)
MFFNEQPHDVDLQNAVVSAQWLFHFPVFPSIPGSSSRHSPPSPFPQESFSSVWLYNRKEATTVRYEIAVHTYIGGSHLGPIQRTVNMIS